MVSAYDRDFGFVRFADRLWRRKRDSSLYLLTLLACIMEKSSPFRTILIIFTGLLVLYLLKRHEGWLYAAIIVSVLGSISSYLAQKIDYLWRKLGWLLSLFVPKILLTLIFFLVLTPIALLSRLFGEKDPLSLKKDYTTMFKDHSREIDQDYFEKTW